METDQIAEGAAEGFLAGQGQALIEGSWMDFLAAFDAREAGADGRPKPRNRRRTSKQETSG